MPRRRQIAATFALVLAGAVVTWPAGPAQSAQPARCPPPAITVLERFADVIVYRRHATGTVHAPSIDVCVRATRRVSRLTHEAYYEDFAGRRALAARGDFVAWAQVTRDDGADGDVAVIDVQARDLSRPPGSSGLSVRSNGTRYGCVDTGAYCISAQAVSQIVIAADRTVVWVACDGGADVLRSREAYDRCGRGARSVWAATRGYSLGRPAGDGALRELARGATIASRSLRLSAGGRRVSWLEHGTRRSADV